MHFTPPFLHPELVFKTSRSGGKGGQNVNKVASKVQVEFAIASSQLLNEEEKTLLLEKLGDKLSKEGTIQVIAQESRSQLENKEKAVKKLYSMLNRCFVVRRKRKATKPSRSSVEQRLKGKKRDALIKQSRRKGLEE